MITCLNCGEVYDGKYCPGCGQKATVTKLTWKSLTDEIVHFFTHAEHSFVYTSKRLITAPGAVMKDFLDGKRKLIHKPVTFLIIWALGYQLLETFFKYCKVRFNLYEFPAADPVFRILWTGSKNPWIANYEKWIALLIQAPLLVLTGWFVFRKTRTSFVERWVIVIYGICAMYMLSIVMTILTFLLRLAHVPVSKGSLNDGYFLAYLLFIAWMVYGFLKTFRPQMPGYQRIVIGFIASLLANYIADLAYYLLYWLSDSGTV